MYSLHLTARALTWDPTPAMIRVMIEWTEAVHGLSAEIDLENVRALADAVSNLTGCLRKCLASTAYNARPGHLV